MYAGKAGAYHIVWLTVPHLKGRPFLKLLESDKHTSLLFQRANGEERRFITSVNFDF
jgi:hypothetical protein